METTYLQEYVRVADKGSFTAAARELHLTQSTLSKHVAVLEREFGVDLFVRDRLGIRMTEAGKALYTQALQFEGLLRKTQAMVRAAGDRADQACEASSGDRVGQAMGDGAASGRLGWRGTNSGAEASLRRDTELRCKCRRAAERYGLDEREAGALILYLEEHGFESIQVELGLSRDEVADVLGRVYRKLGVSGKQEALDFIHSVSE